MFHTLFIISDDKSSEEESGSAVAIPSENLIKDGNNATASNPKISGGFPDAPKESIPGSSNSENENVLEKPSNTKKLETSTASQTFQGTTDNTRNNLIKELKGSDIGSKILHGIVAVTNASEYSDVMPVGQQETDEKRKSSTQESVDQHKPQDDANVVNEDVQLVTRKSENGITPSTKSSISSTPLTDTTSNQATLTSSEANIAASSEGTSQATLKETPQMTNSSTSKATTHTTTTSKEPIQTATFDSSKEAPPRTTISYKNTSEESQEAVASSFALEESEPTIQKESEPVSEVSTGTRNFTDRISTPSEDEDLKESISSNETTSSQPTTVVETMKESIVKLEETVSTPFSTVTETEAVTTASVSESSLVPIIVNMTSQDESVENRTSENVSESQNVSTLPSVQETVNTATTVSQEVNDIPEAYTRVKGNNYREKSSSEVSDEVNLPSSTPLTTKVTSKQWEESSKPSPGTSPKYTTPSSFGSTKTTTELTDSGMPTSTQSILEATTVSKSGRPEPDNETATAWGTLPATDVSKEEETSKSSVELPTTTVKILQTTESGQPGLSSANTGSAVDVVETTTNQYDQKVRHKDMGGSTSTEYAHIGLSEKPDDDHDETLKYNVTTVDHPHGNGTEPDDSEEEPEDDAEKDGDVHTTTTLVIIEEITTSRATTTRTTAIPVSTGESTTQPTSSTTSREKVDQDTRPPTRGKS